MKTIELTYHKDMGHHSASLLLLADRYGTKIEDVVFSEDFRTYTFGINRFFPVHDFIDAARELRGFSHHHIIASRTL